MDRSAIHEARIATYDAAVVQVQEALKSSVEHEENLRLREAPKLDQETALRQRRVAKRTALLASESDVTPKNSEQELADSRKVQEAITEDMIKLARTMKVRDRFCDA